jgi:hypothetical protein
LHQHQQDARYYFTLAWTPQVIFPEKLKRISQETGAPRNQNLVADACWRNCYRDSRGKSLPDNKFQLSHRCTEWFGADWHEATGCVAQTIQCSVLYTPLRRPDRTQLGPFCARRQRELGWGSPRSRRGQPGTSVLPTSFSDARALVLRWFSEKATLRASSNEIDCIAWRLCLAIETMATGNPSDMQQIRMLRFD